MMVKTIAASLLLGSAALASSASAAVVDGSFETQGSGISNSNGYCYFGGNYNPPACPSGAWTGGGNTSGLQNEGNSDFPGAESPAGSYYAFIQSGYGAPGSISQTLALAAGSYVLNWLDAGRPNNGGNQGYDVLINGINIFSGATTTGQPFTSRTSNVFTFATGGNYTLTFQARDSGGDNTAYIDNVAITAVPETATWAMMILGFGLVGGTLRRRKGKLALA